MSEDIKGVFVRLPLSDSQREQYLDLINSGEPLEAEASALEEGILAIGTPVTGGDIPVIGTIHIGENGKPFFTAPELYSVGGDVVRQSDAQAQIAALEAEVVRLREALSEIAESDDTDNALDPERNKRVAREALKGGAA